MLRIFLHMMVLPAMLWLERHGRSRLRPLHAALVWYALGVPLIAVETSASPGPDRLTFLLQSLFIALFFLPPAYFAFKYAERRQRIIVPFLVFIVLALVAGVVAAIVLAHAPVVFSDPIRGLDYP